MKKIISIFAILTVILSFSTMFTSCGCGGEEKKPAVVTTPDGKTYYRGKETIITYKLDGQTVEKQVNDDKSLALQGIFNNMNELEKKPDCKFNDKFMITFNGKKYYVAQDGCSIIKHDHKYYKTAVSDRHILNDIFEEYGATDILEID